MWPWWCHWCQGWVKAWTSLLCHNAVLAGPMLQPVLPRLCTSPVHQPALPSVAGARESDSAVEQRAGPGRPRQRKQRAVSRQPSPLTNTKAPPSCSPLGFQTPLALAQTSHGNGTRRLGGISFVPIAGKKVYFIVSMSRIPEGQDQKNHGRSGNSLQYREAPQPAELVPPGVFCCFKAESREKLNRSIALDITGQVQEPTAKVSAHQISLLPFPNRL